ncbi:hypothetical protein ACWPKS_01285 [Coraliomargarita sp. W4R72]
MLSFFLYISAISVATDHTERSQAHESQHLRTRKCPASQTAVNGSLMQNDTLAGTPTIPLALKTEYTAQIGGFQSAIIQMRH